jgi:hypothetical protein
VRRSLRTGLKINSRLAICRDDGGDVEVVWRSEALRSAVVDLQGGGGVGAAERRGPRRMWPNGRLTPEQPRRGRRTKYPTRQGSGCLCPCWAALSDSSDVDGSWR